MDPTASAAPHQEIRFCSARGRQLAYATAGTGPPLLMTSLWVSHLELEWGFPEFRAFAAALARRHTLIRYDPPGAGMSDRADAADPSLDAAVDTIDALLDALGVRAASLLGISWHACAAAAFAARRPERVERLVVFGGCAHGEAIAPAPVRDAVLATVRAHWGSGARLLTDAWLPGADAATRRRFAEFQRAAAPPDVAAATLDAIYRIDVRDLLGQVRAPALVLHRRDDRAIPFAQGRELAALLPDARLTALEGDQHLPWHGDAGAALGAVEQFLAEGTAAAATADRPPPAAAGGPLSERELDVLRLVAEGLTDEQIAAALIVSPHTVHRHVANIRFKLGQPSKAAAAAHAARKGLI